MATRHRAVGFNNADRPSAIRHATDTEKTRVRHAAVYRTLPRDLSRVAATKNPDGEIHTVTGSLHARIMAVVNMGVAIQLSLDARQMESTQTVDAVNANRGM